MLVRHLNEANHRELLTAAKGKSKRQMKLLVAEWFPKDPVPPRIRKRPSPRTAPAPAPTPTTEPSATAPAAEPFMLTMPAPATKPGKVEPLAPALFKVEFTADQQFYDDIEKAKALLGPHLPRGELSELFGRAVRLLVEDLEKKKYAKTSRPRRAKRKAHEPNSGKRSRHVPNEVKREVAERDGGQCTFVDEDGNRCQERWGIELHHDDVAFARSGAHTAQNISLMCRTHNRLLAEQEFGAEYIAAKITAAQDEANQLPRGRFQ